jgi:hypothetical protein
MVEEAEKQTRWLIFIYRIPREPSRPRVAAWRKLKTLGALYLQDGVAALPEDAVTREQLQWLQLNIREAGGEATLWDAAPETISEEKRLVESFRDAREEGYRAIIDEAERLRRKSELGADEEALRKELSKVERDFRAERRRDYFHSPLRKEALSALKAAQRTVKGNTDPAEEPGPATERGGEEGY